MSRKSYAGLPGLATEARRVGYSVPRLARLLDRDPAALQAIIRGDRPCTPQLAEVLCRTLQCSIRDLQPFYPPKGGPTPAPR